MSTTFLFIELLVVGIETLLWISLILCSVFGFGWIVQFSSLIEKANILVSLFTISLAYLIGIIFDELCDFLIERWDKNLREKVHYKNLPDLWEVKDYVTSHSSDKDTKLDYMKNRLRILRSSIFNLPLIGASLILLLTIRFSSHEITGSIIISIALTFLITFLAIFTFKRITKAYWLKIQGIYRSIIKSQNLSSVQHHAGIKDKI